jgi:predicted nuclease of predicted toxin-antitoxin system
MAKFLIDLNLPYYFSLWNSDEFIHLKDINEKFSDEKIWEYAEKNNLTIISKDCDFSNRILFKIPPLKLFILNSVI